MERRRRLLFRELLPGCNLMIAVCALPDRPLLPLRVVLFYWMEAMDPQEY